VLGNPSPSFARIMGNLMEKPFLVSVTTGALGEGANSDAMKGARLAIEFGHRVLLLDAFGRGICGNNPPSFSLTKDRHNALIS
jgi:hypothetical protein